MQSIPIPLDQNFSSYDEAYHTLIQHSLENGYGFQPKESRPYGSEIKTSYNYRCDKVGNYISQATSRKTKS